MQTYTNKIDAILKCRDWEGPHGTLYFYSLKMSDGTFAEVAKKKENAFEVGQELTYTLEDAVNKATGEPYKKLKEFHEDRQFGGKDGGKSFGDKRSFALSYSKDITVQMLASGLCSPNEDDVIRETLKMADAFYNWLEQKPAENPHTVFTGDGMRPANDADVPSPGPVQHVIQGSPPEIEAQRPRVSDQAPQNASEPQEKASGGKTKPDFGGMEAGGKPPSEKQVALMQKLAGEQGINLNQLIAREWDDIDSVEQISSWATSYVIDLLLHKKA